MTSAGGISSLAQPIDSNGLAIQQQRISSASAKYLISSGWHRSISLNKYRNNGVIINRQCHQ